MDLFPVHRWFSLLPLKLARKKSLIRLSPIGSLTNSNRSSRQEKKQLFFIYFDIINNILLHFSYIESTCVSQYGRLLHSNYEERIRIQKQIITLFFYI
jgi:hypothetical protein